MPTTPRPGADSARLFVAAEIPPEVRADLAAAVRRAGASGSDGLRWSRTEAWHLTLVFCGSVPAARIPELETRLARAATRHPAFELRIAGAGRFDQRVLWAGLAGDRDRLVALAASATAAARRTGIAVDDRPYRPHLTLARGGPGADLRAPVTALEDYAGPVWTTDRLALVESRLGAGPGGTSQYDVRRTWRLGGSDGS